MCRMMASVQTGGTPWRTTLGGELLDQFRDLSAVHRDGWGALWSRDEAWSRYVSGLPLVDDPAVWAGLSALVPGSVLVHERWASPGLGFGLDFQQPFVAGRLAFAHNGTIGRAGENIVDRPSAYRSGLGLPASVTRSDSALYFEVFADRLSRLRGAAGGDPSADELVGALSSAVARLRQDFPDASYNALIESPGWTLAVRAHADAPTYSPGLRRGYEAAGWSHRIESYYELGWRSRLEADGSRTTVVSSSGYAATDGWERLPNHSALAVPHDGGEPRILGLAPAPV